jgi:hypothetical protein
MNTPFYPPSQTSASKSVGRNIALVDQQFAMRAERKAGALSAVQQAIRAGITLTLDVGEGPPLRTPFHFSNEPELLAANTLEELLTACGISPLHADGAAGEITGVELASEYEYTEEYELFKLIAPFVEPGYLELKSDDTFGSEHWRYNFNGTSCLSISPQHVWTPFHPRDLPGGEALLIVPARYLRPFLERLWLDLSAVPTAADPPGEPRILQAFYLWRRGTPLTEIRLWFDAQYAAWGGVHALTSGTA